MEEIIRDNESGEESNQKDFVFVYPKKEVISLTNLAIIIGIIILLLIAFILIREIKQRIE